jgi:competence protein ComGC
MLGRGSITIHVSNGTNMRKTLVNIGMVGKGALREQRGFNIIEFLIFAALIVMLALIVIPNINMFMGVDKKITAANVEALNVRAAANAYQVNTGKYPSDSDILLTNDYVGQTRAYYTFDIGNGRILNATTDTGEHVPTNAWTGIRWDYTSGSWVKQ